LRRGEDQETKQAMTSSWSPDQYLRFGDERTRPAAELAARIAVPAPRTVVDLGCGPGNSAAILRARWPLATVTGLDSSPEMIAAARRTEPSQPWILDDAETWNPTNPFDVVFSSAAIQWMRDHEALVRRLFGHVASGGAFAFQIPSRAYSTLTQLMVEVAEDARWKARLDRAGAARALTMHPPAFYYDALADRAERLDIWETEYQHVLPTAEAIVDWIASTGLRPFLDALADDGERRQFRDRLTARVGEAYPRRLDGRVLFPFKRLFLIAYRPSA
jgi:trans-aconitate 2-methyltransferase